MRAATGARQDAWRETAWSGEQAARSGVRALLGALLVALLGALTLGACGASEPGDGQAGGDAGGAPMARDGEADLVLWHTYGPTSREAASVEAAVAAFEAARRAARDPVQVRVLPVSNEAYTNKLTTAIPRGNGPDVFIGQHDQLGHWARSGMVAPLDERVEAGWFVDEEGAGRFPAVTLQALRYGEALYGLPMTFKSPVLIYNRRLLEAHGLRAPPQDTDGLLALIEAHTDLAGERYGLVYEITNFYYHSAWLHGFGGRVFERETGGVEPFATEANAASLAFARELAARMPRDLTGARVKELFRAGDALMVISGPWFLDNLEGVDVGVATLPRVSGHQWAEPFATIEGVFLSAYAFRGEDAGSAARQQWREAAAVALMKHLAGAEGARIRALEGGQTVAHVPTYALEAVAADPTRAALLAQLEHAIPTSNDPAMSAAWEPLNQALETTLYGAPAGTTPYWMLLGVLLLASAIVFFARMDSGAAEDPRAQRRRMVMLGLICLGLLVPVVMQVLGASAREVAPLEVLEQAEARYATYLAPAVEAVSPAPYIVIAGAVILGLVAWGVARARQSLRETGVNREELRLAAAFVTPTTVAILLLIVAPFAVGSALSLFAHQDGQFIFVGLHNFERLFSGASASWTDTLSFYFTLVVTVLWTALNVFLHVTIGLGLALLLRDEKLRLRGLYRVLLIIPWAVPNYITALVWRGMFDAQKGAVNGVLVALGLEPVYWFESFVTSFTANLVTNTWLGFPFMMVVTLGALQSIPTDLEDAAAVDGATRWQRFRHVTLPLLRPALVPAIILGSVWTFNMFNIIYLVSGGAPDGSTEILISEAYKWAFERQFQYGYAAAYALLIFFILVGYSRLTRRITEGGAA